MAVSFKEEIKSNLGLIIITFLLGGLLFFLGKKLLTKSLPGEVVVPKTLREIVISEDVLKNELLEELSPLEPIPPSSELGRENPFLPY